MEGYWLRKVRCLVYLSFSANELENDLIKEIQATRFGATQSVQDNLLHEASVRSFKSNIGRVTGVFESGHSRMAAPRQS